MIKLVVADDAPFIREIVRQIVTRAGWELLAEAANGEEAVNLALGLRPDVILMDIIMPRKSGIDAAKDILAANPAAQIIAFSTADQEVMVMRALEAGCCSFVVKPFHAEELLRAIREAVEG